MQRLAGWVDFVEKSGERWYYLKMDVEKFFYRMDHEVLMSIIRKKIGDSLNIMCAMLPEHLDFRLE